MVESLKRMKPDRFDRMSSLVVASRDGLPAYKD